MPRLNPIFAVPAVMMLLSSAHAANRSGLDLEEQARMDRVLLKYMLAEGKIDCAAGRDFDCYVALQGREASQQYLNSIGAPPGRLRPWPEADAVRADPKRNYIGSGHNALRVNIGGFSMTGPDTAHATVRTQCGALCGSISTATMKKTNGEWIVQAFTVDIMQ